MALNVVGYTDSRLSEKPSIYNGGKTDTNVVNIDNENNIIYVNSSKVVAKDNSIEVTPGEYTHRAFSDTEVAVKIKESNTNRLKLTKDGLYVGASSEQQKQADWDMLDTEDSSYINNKPFQTLGDTLVVENNVLDVKKPYLVDIEKVDDYLYNINYDELEYDYAKEYFSNDKDEVHVGACSAIRKGNIYGRQLDWLYDNQVEFVVKTPASNNRHGVIGVTSNIPKLTKDFVETKRWDEIYRVLPFKIVDGINDCGLVCNTNVVPLEKGHTTGTIPTEGKLDEICTSMLPRYILDNFSNAIDAAEYIQKHISIYVPKSIHELGYEVHIMVADRDNTFVIEFIDNTVKVIDIKEYPFITNFHLYDVYRNEDGSVYTPETQDDEHNAVITNNITEHGSGLERYNLINEYINTINSAESMRLFLNELNYTNAYNRETDPFWYTEFVHENVTVKSDINEFEPIVNYAINDFENRSRETATTWQTVHSSIYDINNKTLSLKVQEKDIEYSYRFNYYNKEEIDAIIDDIHIDFHDIENRLNNEISRATTRENLLESAIDSEVARAQEAETILQNNIDTEISDREQADQSLSADIVSERERAESAERNLNAAIQFEVNRAEQEENSLSTRIDEEVQARESADNKLTEDLASEVEIRSQQVASLTASLTAEEQARIEKDTQLTNSINTEAERAQNKENELNTAIQNEIQRATEAESNIEDAIESLGNDIDAEIARAEAKELELANNIEAEVTRAKDAEKLLTDNLAAEITAREQADNGLSQSISTEITNRTNADTALDQKITAEIQRATQKEGSLQEALNNEINRAAQAESTLTSNLNQEITDRQQAIKATENKITAEETRAQGIEAELLENIEGVADRVETIENKIPNQASADNQLADKKFVNDSISTNTANFIGTFNSVEELNQYAGIKTNNDYAFVVINDETTGFVKEYDRYKWNGSQWLFEYSLNNSSFTEKQWQAINSGATTDLINQITTNKEDIESLSDTKVDKISGKQLSTEDFTTAEKQKLASLYNYDDANVKADIQSLKTDKQDKLVSGTNIKTINNESILGSGDIEIKYTQGDGISIINNVISADNTIARQDTVNTELSKKVDKVEGKSLISDAEIARLANVDNYDDSVVKQALQDLGSDISELQAEIPTNVSELNNDSGYITATDYATSDKGGTVIINDNGLILKADHSLAGNSKTEELYNQASNDLVIAKGTLDILLAKKQATISDLDTIRSGAQKGATAVQDANYTHTDNNFTTIEKEKLQGIEVNAQVNTITGVKGDNESEYRIGNINITKANIGLSDVNNTSDLNKPISTATQNALNDKQNKLVSGVNIKTINNQSILGTGNIHIEGGGSDYTAGDGIDITDSTISVKDEIARKTYVDDSIDNLVSGVSGNIPIYNGTGFEDSGAIPLFLGDEEDI